MASEQMQSESSIASASTPRPGPSTTSTPKDTAKEILSDILQWSEDRPDWQRDALRRLFTANKLSAEDRNELLQLCKSAHGLARAAGAKPLTEGHLSVGTSQTIPVSISAITHLQGVNALAPEQTVAFGPKLTVVYGPNAAGKSGYTRILKRACRSRGVEEILGNVLSGEAPPRAHATIRYREGTTEVPLDWSPEAAPSSALANVTVFDSHCAAVYLKDKTDVAFRPFGLDIFDKLSTACGDVRELLEAELTKINKVIPKLPMLPEGTRARAVVDTLTALTKVEEVRALANLSPAEETRTKELQEQRRDFQSSDPKQRSRELRLKADRYSLVIRHLESVSSVFSEAKLSELRKTREAYEVARQVLSQLRETAITADLLPGTGSVAWKEMWEVASSFSGEAYPGQEFPVLIEGARCPFCQQVVGADAAARLRHFAEYATSDAQAQAERAKRSYDVALDELTRITINTNDVGIVLEEITSEDAELAGGIKASLAAAAKIQEAVKNVNDQGPTLPKAGVSTVTNLRNKVVDLQSRAAQLLSESAVFDPKLELELRELESRAALRAGLDGVLDEIERKKQISAYRQCIEDTSTAAITRKSTDLTKELVTDNLRNTFQEELKKLEFTHLAVEIQSAGGAKGALFHKLAFSNAPGIAVSNVLSEGESRTLTLAAFLTELSTAPSNSAIIFDDPVSSLDHDWRQRIARRLVAEAAKRQVIVFTHDLLFLRLLLDEAAKREIDCEHQYVRREGSSGICSPDLPWIAMPVKDRIGKLRVKWQAADKVHRTEGQDAYESIARELYGLIREAWERGVTEVLLNDVVERYRHSIETKKLKPLHDIQESDYETVDKEMAECSRWIRGHDQAAADGTPVPGPAELKTRIDELENWVKTIRKRRQ